jgi:hypothetical protein
MAGIKVPIGIGRAITGGARTGASRARGGADAVSQFGGAARVNRGADAVSQFGGAARVVRGADAVSSPMPRYRSAAMPVRSSYRSAPIPVRSSYRSAPIPVRGTNYRPVSITPPPSPNKTSPGFFAQHGKKVAAGVAVGALGMGVMTSRTGKGVDSQTGLPRGMYNY